MLDILIFRGIKSVMLPETLKKNGQLIQVVEALATDNKN